MKCENARRLSFYLADTGDSRYSNFAVEIVLHGVLTEEQVHLIIITIWAIKTLSHKIHVDKIWL